MLNTYSVPCDMYTFLCKTYPWSDASTIRQKLLYYLTLYFRCPEIQCFISGALKWNIVEKLAYTFVQIQEYFVINSVHLTPIFISIYILLAARCWWRNWLRHCATSQKVAGLIPHSVIGNFYWHNLSGRTKALGLTQPLTEMISRNISWG
jgi:hypothetical protein